MMLSDKNQIETLAKAIYAAANPNGKEWAHYTNKDHWRREAADIVKELHKNGQFIG